MRYISCPFCKQNFSFILKEVKATKTRKHIKDIIKLRKEGNTLGEIGKKFNVTRERIRQLLKEVPGMEKYRTPKIPKYRVGYKKCLTCRKIMKFDFFYKSKGKSDRFGYTQRCIKCIKRNSLKYMKTKDYQKGGKYWLKQKARSLLNYYLKKGHIVKGDCIYKNEDCLGRIEAHHNDYTKPLEVIWLCVKHHQEYDKHGFKYI